MKHPARILRASLLACATLGPAAAAAQPRADDVEAQHTQGNRLREQGRHAEARDLFRALYERTREPRALVREGLAEMALQEWVAAEEHLDAGLAAQGNRWVDENRARITGALREVQTHVGSLRVECAPAGAAVYVDDVARGTCPLAAPLRLPAGNVTVRVQSPDAAAESAPAAIVAGTEPTVLRFALQHAAAAQQQPPPRADGAAQNRRRGTMIALGVTSLALGGAGLAAGAVGFFVTGDDGRALSTPLGVAGVAAGGVFVVTGVVLLALAPARVDAQAAARRVLCAPTLAAPGLGCAFAF